MSDDLLLFLLAGFKFWKIGSRKIFAISQDGKQRISHKRTISESDSDEDFEPVKKRRTDDTTSQRILSEIKDIRKNVEDISKKLKLPFGLHKQLQDAIYVVVCQSNRLLYLADVVSNF